MDRKDFPIVPVELTTLVALRKESVDRKIILRCLLVSAFVALRKESVDRKFCDVSLDYKEVRRSPQGERG